MDHGYNHNAMSPVPRMTSIGHLEKPMAGDHSLGTPIKSGNRSVDGTSVEEEINGISRPSTISTQSPIHFVLGNFVFAVLSITLIIFTFFFAVTWFTVFRDARSTTDRILSNSATGVLILGHGVQLDLDTRALSISWKVVACDANATSEDPFWDAQVPVRCKPFDTPIDVYLNEYVRVPSTANLSEPIFSSVPRAELVSKQPGIRSPPTFTVEHRFDRCGKGDSIESFMVPFHRYSFNAVAFAIDPTTNHSIPIAMFGVLDALGDFIIRSHDAADTNEFTYNSGKGQVTAEVESRVVRVEIARSAISKAITICLFLVNWTLTVGSVYITVLVSSRMLEVNSVVATLPFSASLTIPMVRSLYVDSQPSGISIDTAAFFVQIVTVGLCSLVLFGVLTSRQSSPPPPSNLSV